MFWISNDIPCKATLKPLQLALQDPEIHGKRAVELPEGFDAVKSELEGDIPPPKVFAKDFHFICKKKGVDQKAIPIPFQQISKDHFWLNVLANLKTFTTVTNPLPRWWYCPANQEPSKGSKKKVTKRHLKGKKGKKAKGKKANKAKEVSCEKEKDVRWKGHDLKALGIPTEAWPPADREYKGKHGYTLTAPNRAVPNSALRYMFWVLAKFAKNQHSYVGCFF